MASHMELEPCREQTLNQAAVIEVFDRCFAESFATVVCGGAPEPSYEPADGCVPARLYCREDYVASALHEVAHWCLAGRDRRLRLDFGFNYQPPPRTTEQQKAFFRAELRAQTLELIFSNVAGVCFYPSIDDLDGLHEHLVQQFERDIVRSVPSMLRWLQTQQGRRARVFREALRVAAGQSERRESDEDVRIG